jgi:tRNA nucleotidyltransferase/poly(A) polymerase
MNLKEKVLILPFFHDICEVEKETAAKIYFVGGTVRDLLLNRNISDLDLVVFEKDYTYVADVLSKKLKGTKVQFKDNVRIVKNNFIIDVSKPRGLDIFEDLKERDFTINNLALDVNGKLFGDTTDLKEGVIRVISEKSFIDDSLRVFRAFRFYSELNFEISKETIALIDKYKKNLKNVATERIYQELKKTVLGSYFLNALKYLEELEIFDVIIPELSNLKDLPTGTYHNLDPYRHTFCTVKQTYLEAIKRGFSGEALFILTISALLHDIGKGLNEYKDKHGRYIGHEEKGAKLAGKILKRLNFSNFELQQIVTLIKKHTTIRIYAVNRAKEKTLKKFIFDYYKYLPMLYVITLGDNGCKPINYNFTLIHDTIKRLEKLKESMNFNNKSIITGRDLIQLGFPPSKKFKDILKDVHFKLVIGELNNKDQALDYIIKNYKGKGGNL